MWTYFFDTTFYHSQLPSISRRLLCALTVLCGVTMSVSHAEEKIDLSGKFAVTPHELAVIQVLSEICPPMLADKQKQQFYQGYNTLLIDQLDNVEEPKAVMQYLSKQPYYQDILNKTRQDTTNFTRVENKLACLDIVNYNSISK